MHRCAGEMHAAVERRLRRVGDEPHLYAVVTFADRHVAVAGHRHAALAIDVGAVEAERIDRHAVDGERHALLRQMLHHDPRGRHARIRVGQRPHDCRFRGLLREPRQIESRNLHVFERGNLERPARRQRVLRGHLDDGHVGWFGLRGGRADGGRYHRRTQTLAVHFEHRESFRGRRRASRPRRPPRT